MRTTQLALTIAESFARHLRPQARQMPMFTGDDYTKVTDDIAWRGDVFVDDDYIFGAHLVVVHRKTPEEALNRNLESLFIRRQPPSEFHEVREYTTHWLRNGVSFGEGGFEWIQYARMSFMDWYGAQNDRDGSGRSKTSEHRHDVQWMRERWYRQQVHQWSQYQQQHWWPQPNKFTDLTPS